MINTKNPPKDTLPAAIICTIIFAGWAILVSLDNQIIQNFDKAVVNLICNKNVAITNFSTTFTNLGNTSTIVIETIILFVILMVFKQFSYAIFTAGTMIAANGYNWLIKHAIARPRPRAHHLVFADGFSFPSGHSVGSITLFGILIILTILLIKKRILKSILIFIWACFPLLIGYTRIFNHVHYPSDVLGGFIEGLAILLISFSILKHYYLDKKTKTKN